MSMPYINPSNIPYSQSVTDIIESIALEQTALSHILNAEGEKIQRAVNTAVSHQQLVSVNKSVNELINSVTRLEMVLHAKLELFEGCLCPSTSSTTTTSSSTTSTTTTRTRTTSTTTRTTSSSSTTTTRTRTTSSSSTSTTRTCTRTTSTTTRTTSSSSTTTTRTRTTSSTSTSTTRTRTTSSTTSTSSTTTHHCRPVCNVCIKEEEPHCQICIMKNSNELFTIYNTGYMGVSTFEITTVCPGLPIRYMHVPHGVTTFGNEFTIDWSETMVGRIVMEIGEGECTITVIVNYHVY